jgi:hypothetical protein
MSAPPREDSPASPWTAAAIAVWAAGGQLNEAIAAAGMVGTLASLLVDPAGRAELLAAARQLWPVLLFVAWAVLGPLATGATPTSSGLFRVLDWLFVPVAAAAVSRLPPRWQPRVVAALAITLVASSGVAALQHFGAFPDREHLGGLISAGVPVERVYEEIPGSPGRFMAGGLLFHRLKFAHVGGLAVIWLLATGLDARGRGRGRAAAAVLAASAVGLLAILFFPLARAASVALLISLALTAFRLLPSRRTLALIGAGLLALVAVMSASPALRDRFARASSVLGNEDRSHLRAAGLRAVAEHPVAGLGAGRFRARDYLPPDAPEIVRHHSGKAHLQVLSIAADTGIVGALLFLAALTAILRRTLSAGPRPAAALGCLAYLLLLGLLHDPLFHAEVSMSVALALGAGVAPAPGRPHR